MSYRFMRLLVFFDLPVETTEDRKEYRKFRKLLIRSGFVMLQESVYTKLLITPTMEESVTNMLTHFKPPKGLVQILSITEKQFSKIRCLTGEYKSDLIDYDKRLIVL